MWKCKGPKLAKKKKIAGEKEHYLPTLPMLGFGSFQIMLV